MAHIPFLSHYLERKNIEYQNQLLARQVEEVQNIYLTMRGWRHDYHNHLQSMKAYVEMGLSDIICKWPRKTELPAVKLRKS